MNPTLAALFGIRLAASTVQYSTYCGASPSCSWQTHVQLSRVESETKFKISTDRGTQDLCPLRLLPPLFASQWATSKGGRWGRGNITFTHSESFTDTPTSYRNTPNISSSSGTGASIGTGYVDSMLPSRPHLDWIDSRSKHITRQGSLQTRS
jgi:hypothetical protein